MLMAFGDDAFKRVLTGNGEGKSISPFMGISATFVHFIVIQVLALLLGLIGKARILSSAPPALQAYINAILPPNSLVREVLVLTFWGAGYCLFLYAIALTLAATFGIFRVSGWFERVAQASKNASNQNNDGQAS